MITKQNVAKLLILLVFLGIFMPLMTGCGIILSQNKAGFVEKHPDGNGKSHMIILGSPGETEVKNGKTKYPWFVIVEEDRTRAELSAQSPLNLKFLHVFGHYIASAVGATPSDDYADCPAAGTALNLTPGNVINLSLEMGKGLVSGFGSLSGIAMGILVTIWGMNFLTDVVHERFTMESVLKGLCELIIGAFVISQAGNIVQAFMQLVSNAGGGGGGGAGTFAGSLSAVLSEPCPALGFGMNFSLLDTALFGFVVWSDPSLLYGYIGIIPLYALIKCAINIFSAMLITGAELALRVTCAPLVLALSAKTGWGPHVLTYIKQSMACAFHPTIVLLLANAFEGIPAQLGLSGNLLYEALGTMVGYMILNGFITESKSIARSIFGH